MREFLRTKQFYNMLRSYCKEKGYTLFSFKEYSKIHDLNYCKIDENILEKNDHLSLEDYDRYLHIIRCTSEFIYDALFDVIKLEYDENTNDTPKRLSKMLVPHYTVSNELLSGRWTVKPTLTKFSFDECEYEDGAIHKNVNNIVKIKVNLYSLCSHHFLPFGTFNNTNASALICYIPDQIYPGLSKIGRYVNYISRRGWMQEKLSEAIGDSLLEEFKLKGVYVHLENMIHTCSIHRGYADDTLMSTEYYNGIFKQDKELLQSARQMV